MEVCAQSMPAGVNVNCLAALAQVKNIVILQKGTKFTNIDDFLNLASWKTKINIDLTAYAVAGLYDYEVTTEDPNVKTSGLGKKLVTSNPTPSANFFLDSNFCDYKNLVNTLKGGLYDVVYLLNDNSMLGTINADGTVSGFSARLNAITKGIPAKDDLDLNYIVYVNHTSYSQFEAGLLKVPTWNADIELPAAMPVGLAMVTTVAYETTGGTIGVQINERCSDPVIGLLFGDFEVVSDSGLADGQVSAAVDNGNGSYTLTVEADTTTPLASGEWIVIQVQTTEATAIESISNTMEISIP